MSVTYNFNLAQQIYALCSASGAIGECTGDEATLQQKMITALQTELPAIAGGWEVSWGPRVYMPSFANHPQNVWFAAVSESQKMVVVAVAGTSIVSGLDWLNDFDVARVVNFSQWIGTWNTSGIPEPPIDSSPDNDSNTYIANGTARGVYNVLSNPSTVPSNNNSYIWQYLTSLGPGYTVVFTGHSMGGAIVPAMALGLKMANMSGSDTPYTMPSAGPSPGNRNFNDYYTSNFPTISMPNKTQAYEVYNLNLWNENDVVPQAWCGDTTQDRYLQRINGIIYAATTQGGPVGPGIWNVVVNPLVNFAVKRGANSEIGYYGIPGLSFVGQDSIPPITDPLALLQSIGEQHLQEYWDYLGIDEFVTQFKGVAGCSVIEQDDGKVSSVAEHELKMPAPTVGHVEVLNV